MKAKGVIFDFDGCIVDSEQIYLESLVDYFSSKGLSCGKKDFVKYLGCPNGDIINRMKIDFSNVLSGMTSQEINGEQSVAFDKVLNSSEILPMDGLESFLKYGKDNNVIFAIATSSGSQYIDFMLNELNFNKYFDLITTCDDITKGKPDPQIYNMTAEKLNIDKNDLVIIEDSTNGIAAAKASGIYTIGYEGSSIKQDTSQADLIIDSYNSPKIYELV